MNNKRLKFLKVIYSAFFVLAVLSLPFSVFLQKQGGHVTASIVEAEEVYSAVDYSSLSSYDPRGFDDDSDSATFNYLPEVKNQGAIGLCWAYAIAGSLEINLYKNFGIEVDIAEKYLAYFAKNGYDTNSNSLTFGDGQSYTTGSTVNYEEIFNGGGSFEATLNALLSGLGMTEQDYIDNTTSLNSYLQLGGGINWEDYRFSDVAKVVGYASYNGNENLDAIKDEIALSGSVITSIQMENLGTNLYNSTNFSYYASSGYFSQTDHMVEIVGWNDNYSASNFKVTPAGDGAWLVRNSWGRSWGDDGYFWVSYYDLGIVDTGYKSIKLEEIQSRDVLYQYDCGTSVLASFSSGGTSAPITYANVFKNETQYKQELSAVGLYISTSHGEALQNVEIKIYTSNSQMASPVMGVLKKTISKTFYNDGFYKVDLGEKIEIDKGCSFSVVLTNSSPVCAYACFEGDDKTLQDGVGREYHNSKSGQSFMKSASWDDSSSPLGGYLYNNAGIKAYASLAECIEHNYDSGIYTAKTCKEYGYRTYTCKECGHKKIEQDSASGFADHDYVEFGHTEGNCMEHGFTTYECRWCGDLKTVDDDSFGGHDFVADFRVNGDCKQKGYTIDFRCEICGAEEGARVYDLEFGEHKFKQKIVVDGDCCHYTRTVYECEVCEEQMTENNVALGYGKHRFTHVVIVGGEKTIYCEVEGCTAGFVAKEEASCLVVDMADEESADFSLEAFSAVPQSIMVKLKNGMVKIDTEVVRANITSYFSVSIKLLEFKSLQNNGGLNDSLIYFDVSCFKDGEEAESFETQINCEVKDFNKVEFTKVEGGAVSKFVDGSVGEDYVSGTLRNGVYGILLSKDDSNLDGGFVFKIEYIVIIFIICFVVFVGEMSAKGRRRKKENE